MTEQDKLAKDVDAARGVPLKEQNWTDVAAKGIMGMAPAASGWILAFVVLFSVLTFSNYMISRERSHSEILRMERLTEYFKAVEDSRNVAEQNRTDEFRRAQETIAALATALVSHSARSSALQEH